MPSLRITHSSLSIWMIENPSSSFPIHGGAVGVPIVTFSVKYRVPFDRSHTKWECRYAKTQLSPVSSISDRGGCELVWPDVSLCARSDRCACSAEYTFIERDCNSEDIFITFFIRNGCILSRNMRSFISTIMENRRKNPRACESWTWNV